MDQEEPGIMCGMGVMVRFWICYEWYNGTRCYIGYGRAIILTVRYGGTVKLRLMTDRAHCGHFHSILMLQFPFSFST